MLVYKEKNRISCRNKYQKYESISESEDNGKSGQTMTQKHPGDVFSASIFLDLSSFKRVV